MKKKKKNCAQAPHLRKSGHLSSILDGKLLVPTGLEAQWTTEPVSWREPNLCWESNPSHQGTWLTNWLSYPSSSLCLMVFSGIIPLTHSSPCYWWEITWI